MPTQITPTDLGATHLNRVVRIRWQSQHRSKTFETSVRGLLTNVQHGRDGTSVTVDLGATDVTLHLGTSGADVELTDD